MLTNGGARALAANLAGDVGHDGAATSCRWRCRCSTSAGCARRCWASRAARRSASCACPTRPPCSTTLACGGITHTFLVPALLAAMAQVPGAADRDFPALQVALLRRLAHAAAGAAGLPGCSPGGWTQVYGMTEASGVVTRCRSPTTRTPPSRTGWSRRATRSRRGDRDPGPGHRRAGARRRARRDLGALRAAHERLLGQAGGHRRRDHPGRLAALRRRRAHRRRRLRLRHRPDQGHDHQRRREHLPRRDRAGAGRAPRAWATAR